MAKGRKLTNVIESKMKVVFLHGEHNSGKTTTINKLYDQLLSKGAKVIEPRKNLPGKDDFECVLELNNRTIALFSLGDYMYAIGAAIGYYTRVNCDVLVVANSLKNPIYKSSLFKARKHPFTTVEKVRFVDALDALLAELW